MQTKVIKNNKITEKQTKKQKVQNMKKNFQKLSLVSFISSAVVFVINYFFFHFVTDEGISLVWQPEAGKPFVADLIGIFATLFLFGAAISALCAVILFDKNDKSEE